MSRVGELLFDPDDPASISQALTELQRVVDRQIEFGNPNDPGGSATLAGAGTPTTHNGELMNIRGSWVEVEFTAEDTPVTCSHNLGVPVFNSELNVRYFVAGIRHDGTGVAAGSTLSVNYDERDSVGEDSVELRMYHSAGGRTVDATHPLHVSLFVLPAVRWPG